MSKLSGKYIDPASFRTDTASGNGVATEFVLSATPITVQALTVSANGVVSTPTIDYGLAGDTVTFVVAPKLAQKLLFSYIKG